MANIKILKKVKILPKTILVYDLFVGLLAIFTLPTLWATERIITDWVKEAKITKHVTFHCARHTFATLMLTQGADLYTTSKLLGHTSVKTTEIYAKIVDQKKVEAVNLLNGLLTAKND